MEQWTWIVWLALMIAAIGVEAASTALLSIWFVAGSLAALVISFIPGIAWWVELIVAIAVSIACFLAIRPFLKKFMRKEITKSNVDSLIGKCGILSKGCDHLQLGEVKVNGINWSVAPSEEKEIKKGKEVIVVAVKGNTLLVKEKKQ